MSSLLKRPVTQHQLAYLLGQIVVAIIMLLMSMLGASSSFAFPVALGGGMGVFGISLMFRDSRSITFGNILSVTLLTGYFVGYLFLIVSNILLPRSWSPLWFRALYGDVRAEFLLQAATTVVCVSLACAAVGCLQRPLFFRYSDWVDRKRISIYPFVLGLGVIVLAYAQGAVGYMGINAAVSGEVPPIGAIAQLVVAPLAVCALYFGTLERDQVRRQIFYMIFALSEILIIPMGRRLFLYSIVLALIARRVALPSSSGEQKRVNKKGRGGVIKIGIVLALILTVAFAVFASFRQYGYERYGYKSLVTNTGMRVLGGINLLIQHPSDVLRPLGATVGPRTGSLLAYLGEYVRKEETHQAVHGGVLEFSVSGIVPSVLWPGKAQMLKSAGNISEGIIHPRLGMPVFDGPNSIITEGFGDFWYPGAVLYPVAILLLYGISSTLLGRIAGRRWVIFINATLAYSLFAVESSLGRYLIDLRNLIVVLVVVRGVAVMYYGLMNLRNPKVFGINADSGISD